MNKIKIIAMATIWLSSVCTFIFFFNKPITHTGATILPIMAIAGRLISSIIAIKYTTIHLLVKYKIEPNKKLLYTLIIPAWIVSTGLTKYILETMKIEIFTNKLPHPLNIATEAAYIDIFTIMLSSILLISITTIFMKMKKRSKNH